MGNGTDRKGGLGNWLTGIGIAVALIASIFGAASTMIRDTPTRAEMERKIAEAKAEAIQVASASNGPILREIASRLEKVDDIDRRLARIEGRLGVANGRDR